MADNKWVTGVITPSKTGRGPPCINHYQAMCCFGSPGLGYKLHKENANDFEDLGLRDLPRKLSWLKGCILKCKPPSPTLPETNIAPENRPGPKRKRSSSNHPLSGAMLVSRFRKWKM